jgi:hypothetical protein
MELLPFHDELVAGLSSHHKQDDLCPLDIIQHAEVTDTQLELSKRVGPQLLDGLRWRRRLMEETCLDRRFEDALFAHGQCPQLRFGVRRAGSRSPGPEGEGKSAV